MECRKSTLPTVVILEAADTLLLFATLSPVVVGARARSVTDLVEGACSLATLVLAMLRVAFMFGLKDISGNKS